MWFKWCATNRDAVAASFCIKSKGEGKHGIAIIGKYSTAPFVISDH
jgi:hypothetical protein